MQSKKNRSRKKRYTHSEKKGPVRAIIKQSPHRQVGAIHFPGLTVYPAEHESPHERDFISLALVCHDVLSIAAQPEKIEYELDGGAHTYTVDNKIVARRGEILIEIKPLRYLIKPGNLEKYVAIAREVIPSRQTIQGAHL